MTLWARRVTESPIFQYAILAVILANAVLVGLETSPSIVAAVGPTLLWLNRAVLAVFVVEIVLRLLAFGRQPWRFFRDGWNIFDFAVVSISLLPDVGPFATLARLARVFRVLRVVSVLPELRLIVTTLLHSLPSVGNVVALLGLMMYVYGVFGYHLFHALDPAHWGSLGRSLLTLFEMLTLEGWVDVQDAVLPARPLAWLFFGSYVILAVFVVINLFIAIVINSLESAKAEHLAQEDARNPHQSVLKRIEELQAELTGFERALRRDGQ